MKSGNSKPWFNLSLEHLYRPNSPSGSGLWQYKQHWTRVHTEFLADNPQKVPFHTESNSELKKSHIMYYVPVINSPESDRRRVNIQRSSLLFMWQCDSRSSDLTLVRGSSQSLDAMLGHFNTGKIQTHLYKHGINHAVSQSKRDL